ncbi:MAG: ABC transporter substrate-binding protein [Eubacteriales bacterium]|nr:ABC transporter substrate-binding protein [Eubacteriales bacterium]
MKKFLSLLLVLALSLSLVACAGGSTAPATEATEATEEAAATEAPAAEAATEGITIGTISPNTGSLAAYGTAVTTGVDLAISEINAAGGILGQQVTIINADDQMDPTETLNAFNSLVSQGVGLIIGSVASSCTSAITGAANEEGVVLLTPASTADSITTEDDYVFRACYADGFQGAIAAYYASQAGYTDVGVVYCAADTYSKGLYDSFKTAAAKYGVNVVAEESTASLDVQDYTNQFTAMVTAGVQFVYAPFYYDVIGPYIVTQARAAGYTGIIMGADGYDTTPEYVVEGADLTAFNNVYWTNHYDPADTDAKVQSFVQAYKAINNFTPSAIAALAYDSVYMLKQAIEAAGSADASAVRDALADTSAVYTGVTGTFSLDSVGTPAKGAAVLSFASDGSSVTTKLVDVVKELK